MILLTKFVLYILAVLWISNLCKANSTKWSDVQLHRTCFRGANTSYRELIYPDGSKHAVRIPYPGWTSAKVLGLVTYIIVSQVLGYSCVLVKTDGILDYEIVAYAAGCLEPDDPTCSAKDVEHPNVHFTIETWDGGDRRALSMPESLRPQLISVSSYDLIDQWHILSDVFDAGFRSPLRLSLDHHRYYNASLFQPQLFFDHFTRMLTLLPSDVVIRCSAMDRPGPFFRDAAQYILATGDDHVECHDDMIWFSPSCRHQPDRCVPLMVQYYPDVSMQLANFLNIPLAIVQVAPGTDGHYDDYYRAARTGRFLFGWYQPDDTMANEQPMTVSLPPTNKREHLARIYRTGIAQVKPRNYAWRGLQQADRLVAAFASRADWDNEDIRDLMISTRRHRDAAAAATTTTGGDMGAMQLGVDGEALWAAACEWVLGSGKRWSAWVPVVCSAGWEANSALSRCLPCQAGSYCMGGPSPAIQCPAGFFCCANATLPESCPLGRTTSPKGGAASAADCRECAEGYMAGWGGVCVGTADLLGWSLAGSVLASFLLAVGSVLTLCPRRRSRVGGAEEEEDKEAQRHLEAREALRRLLRIRPSDGFLLAGEKAPRKFSDWSRRTILQRNYLDAAVRLWLWEDFDVGLLDAFAVSLRGDSHLSSFHSSPFLDCEVPNTVQYMAFCRWLLSVGRDLLDPEDCTKSFDRDHEAEKHRLGMMSRSVKRRFSNKSTSGKWRFRYFTNRVALLRAWSENEDSLFEELKDAIQEYMNKIARLCEARYLQLVKEPRGRDLVAWPNPANPEPGVTRAAKLVFDIPTEGPLKYFLPDPPRQEGDEQILMSCRQDDPEVGAIRVSAEDRLEASEESVTLASTTPKRTQSLRNRTSMAATHPPALDEQVFISQLHRRACLLNMAFQRRVLSIMCDHATPTSPFYRAWSDSSWPPPADTISKEVASECCPRSDLLDTSPGGNKEHTEPVNAYLQCKFVCEQEVEVVGTVEVLPGPVKSVARMRDKIVEYAPPHPASVWPLSANILDPVRVSIVCDGPSQLLEAVSWFYNAPGPENKDLCVVRAKNKFSISSWQVLDGYRDLKLFVRFEHRPGLGIVGEIQFHDRDLHGLKLQMHVLYKIKRAKCAASIS